MRMENLRKNVNFVIFEPTQFWYPKKRSYQIIEGNKVKPSFFFYDKNALLKKAHAEKAHF